MPGNRDIAADIEPGRIAGQPELRKDYELGAPSRRLPDQVERPRQTLLEVQIYRCRLNHGNHHD
jgi:hypothetical protein